MAVRTRPEGIERRRHPRMRADLVASCRRLGSRSDVDVQMRVLDISQGGARLSGSADVRTGDVMVVKLPRPSGELQLKALVVSAGADVTQPDPIRAHIAWTGVSTEARDQLGSLLGAMAEA